MSFIGIQLNLPFVFSEKGSERLYLSEEAELSFIFHQILKRKQQNTLKSITKLFWPIVAIQGEPNHHLIIDNVGISKFLFTIGNAPRQAQVGAVMRKSELDIYDRLRQAFDILSFKTSIAENGGDLSEEERTGGETRDVEISGLFNPESLKVLETMIPLKFESKLPENLTLSSKYEYDTMLNLSEKFRNQISETTGYIARWQSTKSLIEEPVEKWLLELNANLTDIKARYRSERNKVESMIDDRSKEIQLDSVKDQMENWVFTAKKNIIAKMSGFFKPIDNLIDEINKGNKELLKIETLQTKDPMDVLKLSYRNIAGIRDRMSALDESLSKTSDRLKVIQADLENTQLSAEEKITKIHQELNGKMEEKTRRLQELTQQETSEVEALEKKRDQVESLKNEIYAYISKKASLCYTELEQIRKWQVKDAITRLSNPVNNFFMPAYVALYEDEDEEEILEIFLPCVCGQNLECLPLGDGFKTFQDHTNKTMVRDMKVRTNFEFVQMKNNLLDTPDFKDKVKKGLLQLVKLNVCSEDKKAEIIENLNGL